MPYQVLPTADGHLMLAAGNDNQFRILCSSAVLNREHWAIDDRYATNSQRVKHREILIAELERVLAERTTAEWVKLLTGKGSVSVLLEIRVLMFLSIPFACVSSPSIMTD